MKRIRLFSAVVLVTYTLSTAAFATPLQPVPMADEGSSSLSMRTAHKYLGFGALALGTVAAFSSSSEDIHCASAWGACILGSAALSTGIIEYRKVFNLGDGIGRFDGHALAGGLATVGFITAVLLASSGGEDDDEGEEDDDVNSAHAGIGGAALAAMAVSVVIIELKW